jgi:prepilin-type N-terminal cleavage/methylation domain-containing protein
MMNKKGFTMIELLVAMSLFVVVMGVASTVFIQSLRTQRSIVALMAANDNASLSIEQMMREIRIGSNFTTNMEKTELSFVSQRKGNVVYRWNKDEKTIERNGVALTSKNVAVEYLYFDLFGAGPNDGASTRAVIRLGVSSNEERATDIITNIQTTVSSRQLDV